MGGRRWVVRVAAASTVGVVAAAGLTVGAPVGATGAPFTPGDGYAAGHALALVDVYSSAQLGFNLADATAQYQDGTGTATGAALDSGFITLLSELQTCGTYAYPANLVPPTTTVSTNTNHNSGPVSATNGGASTAPAAQVTVSAAPNARGQSDITSGGAGLPGIAGVSGATVHAEAATTPSRQTRTAVADVRDGTVSLLGGLVQLKDVHWNATVTITGPDSRADRRVSTPTFEIGAVTVAGVTVPFGSPSGYAGALATLNTLAGPLGIQFHLPATTTSTNRGTSSLSIGPMTIALGGKTLVGPALNKLVGGTTLPQIEDALKPGVFDPRTCTELAGLLEPVKPLNAEWNLLGAGYPIILGAAIASLDGGGELDIDLGGVTASVDDAYYPAATFGTPSFETSASGGQPPVAGNPGSPGVPGRPGSILSLPGASVGDGTAAQTRLAVTHGKLACRTTSPVGAPMCWPGHAAAGGIAAAVFTVGLLASDEAFRRRRAAPRVETAKEPAA